MTAKKPHSYVHSAIELLTETLIEKGSEYAASGEFDNFYEQARVAGISVRQVFRGMIGQKLERERVQKQKNKDRMDSVIDIAGYAILFLAYELADRETSTNE